MVRRIGLATQSGASSVGPSEHVWRRWAACRSLMASSRRRSARLKSEVDPSGSGYGRAGAQNRPLRRECLGSDAIRAQEPSLLAPRGSRWLWGGPENAGIVPKRPVPALHREAERDTTGSNSRQHPRTYVDWAMGAREASRAGNSRRYSQSAHQDAVKKPLTLQFYWARKGAWCRRSEVPDSLAAKSGSGTSDRKRH